MAHFPSNWEAVGPLADELQSSHRWLSRECDVRS
jgi:hypothetical protein